MSLHVPKIVKMGFSKMKIRIYWGGVFLESRPPPRRCDLIKPRGAAGQRNKILAISCSLERL